MTNKPTVVLLMRRASSKYFSIERLFEALVPFLSERFDVRVLQVPCHSRGLFRCVRNVVFTARIRADVVHVTGDIYYCALGVSRIRCVLTVHDLCSLDRLTGVRKGLFSLVWYRLPLRWALSVTAISEEIRRQLELEFPVAVGKVELIHNCVDEAFRRNRRPADVKTGLPQVLQVGTGANKNLQRIAIAASALRLHLRIIGPLSCSQRTLLRSLNLSWSSAERLSAEEVIAEYRASDVLMFASTYEGFGLPVVEAQAIGLPVITSNIAPLPEIAGDGALFVDPYNICEIRATLEQLLRSPDLASRLIDLGRHNAERFDATFVADQYGHVYTRALNRATFNIFRSVQRTVGLRCEKDIIPKS